MKLFIIAALVVTADQASKFFITSMMEVGQSIPLINNLLHLTYVRNPGAAFGILPYQTLLFIIITIVVIVAIIYYYRLIARNHRLLRFALALQLGGALGNLIDRVRTGYVIDFFDFKIWPFIFNVADSAIVIGILLFLIAYWRDDALRNAKEMS